MQSHTFQIIIVLLVFTTTAQASLLDVVRSGDIQLVRAEIANGADINQQDPQTGDTALHIAATAGNFEMVQQLLEPPPSSDALGQTHFGLTGILGTASSFSVGYPNPANSLGFIEPHITGTLLTNGVTSLNEGRALRGADAHIRNHSGNSALENAIARGHIRIAHAIANTLQAYRDEPVVRYPENETDALIELLDWNLEELRTLDLRQLPLNASAHRRIMLAISLRPLPNLTGIIVDTSHWGDSSNVNHNVDMLFDAIADGLLDNLTFLRLENNHLLTRLDFHHRPLSAQTQRILVNLAFNDQLLGVQELELSNTALTPETIQSLAQAIRENRLANLVQIGLKGIALDQQDEMGLFQALHKRQPTQVQQVETNASASSSSSRSASHRNTQSYNQQYLDLDIARLIGLSIRDTSRWPRGQAPTSFVLFKHDADEDIQDDAELATVYRLDNRYILPPVHLGALEHVLARLLTHDEAVANPPQEILIPLNMPGHWVVVRITIEENRATINYVDSLYHAEDDVNEERVKYIRAQVLNPLVDFLQTQNFELSNENADIIYRRLQPDVINCGAMTVENILDYAQNIEIPAMPDPLSPQRARELRASHIRLLRQNRYLLGVDDELGAEDVSSGNEDLDETTENQASHEQLLSALLTLQDNLGAPVSNPLPPANILVLSPAPAPAPANPHLRDERNRTAIEGALANGHIQVAYMIAQSLRRGPSAPSAALSDTDALITLIEWDLPELSLLDLRRVRLTLAEYDRLLKAMADMPVLHVTHLMLDGKNLKQNDPRSYHGTILNHLANQALARIIAGHDFPNLTHLHLENNMLGVEAGEALTQAIIDNRLSQLTHLEMANNQLDSFVILALANAIADEHLPNLQYLDLRGNHLSADYIEIIRELVPHQVTLKIEEEIN